MAVCCRQVPGSSMAKRLKTKEGYCFLGLFVLVIVSAVTLWPTSFQAHTEAAAAWVGAYIRANGETKATDGPQEKLSQEKLPQETQELLQILETRLQNYTGPKMNWKIPVCPTKGSKRCLDADCPRQFSSQSLGQRLQQLLDTRTPVPQTSLQTMMSATKAVRAHKYVFVSGASSNHYNEMQGMLFTFFNEVLPRLQEQGEGEDWTLVVFDLGLTALQRNLTQKHCRCTLIDFPFSALPDFAKHLKCYVWKPLIVASLLEKAEYLIWMDASIRWLKTTPLTDLFKRAKAGGLLSRPNGGSLAIRTKPAMAQFFGDLLCQYSGFTEMQTGLVVYYNDRFMREAILRPWLACAFNNTCMCPSSKRRSPPLPGDGDRAQRGTTNQTRYQSRYGLVHRYEQSAIGMMFSKLFLEHRRMLHIPGNYVLVDRSGQMSWFEKTA